MATDSGRQRWFQVIGVALILGAVALEFLAIRQTNAAPVVIERVTETGLEYQVVQATGRAIPVPVALGIGLVVIVAGLYLLRHHEAPTALSLSTPEHRPAAPERRAA